MRTASPIPRAGQPPAACNPDRYKWVALSNTTLGISMATIDSSIVLISLPAIFRGIGLNPLVSSNASYLLWLLMGYMVVTAVLVVSFGRIGDMFGRVKMYNLGFAIFSAGSLAASLTYFGGPLAALYLIAMRIVQGVGGAMIMANSTAIITDAFPEDQRGMALGINSPGPSSDWSLAASWLRWTGTSSSTSRFRSGCSEQSGHTEVFGRLARSKGDTWTGRAIYCSASASLRSWSGLPMPYSPTGAPP